MKLHFVFVLIVFSALVATSCGKSKPEKKAPTPEEMIATSWKLQKINMPEGLAGPEIMGNSTFNFYKNGRYEILMGSLERGKWSLSPDKKVLITTADEMGKVGEMDILQLNQNLLILSNGRKDNPMTMELVPDRPGGAQ
jgi:hypothetical protein